MGGGRGRHGRRIGVWAADPITSAGLLAMLPMVGFDPVLAADLTAVDALLIATDSESDGVARTMTSAAQVEGVPVVWLHRTHDGSPRTAAQQGVSVVCCEELSVHEIGEALLGALLSQLAPSPAADATAAAPQRDDEAVAAVDDDTSKLTALEREGLRLLAEGQDTAEIAARLFYSERTVKNAIARAVHKVGAVNRSSAVATALRRGYL